MELIERYADNIILIDQTKLYNIGDKKTIFTREMFREVYGLDVKIIDSKEGILFYFKDI